MEESKSDKFKRLAGKRTETALAKIKVLGNLAGPSYEWTNEEADELVRKIEEAVNAVKEKFEKRKRTKRS